MATTVRQAARSIGGLARASLRNAQDKTKFGVRNMSGGSYEEELANTNMWRNVTFVGLPIVGGLTVYIFSQAHHHGHEQPAYSYLQIRNKDFPWGTGKENLFDMLSGKAAKE
ncbi:putative subunit VIa of cytochrome c oxidase [Chloropicon primus]|uniref:Putative subunit VIa of cytochrome c oxidase n=1 Tax=Chloropicon primus TaxID=1764295 RepID=A0A5B8MGW7_9CHLO|nr:putative subunit VIa of cytochrome c oxidase [Chloropicon primus]UPQ98533.1 putative subunit VIa of cytochrome c oxidase [Chloropicon primus]|eukprot:QDZ19324.1 putative subunit VIa of cytochrome c oxidase [Chloropicon primus]